MSRHAKRRMGAEAFSRIGSYLRDSREASGLSQTEVAEKLGLSTGQFVSNWERGVSMPPMEYLPKIVKLYKISKAELVQVYTSEQERYIREVLYK